MSPTYKERLAEFASDMVDHYKLEPTKQVGGTHYSKKSIQPWDYIVSNNMGYLASNIIKYVFRWRQKDGIKDLYKARDYLLALIAHEEAECFRANGQLHVHTQQTN